MNEKTCKICLDLIEKSNCKIICKNCKSNFHVNCLIETFNYSIYKDFLCPNCKYLLNIERFSRYISKRNFNLVIINVYDKYYKEFLNKKNIYILKFMKIKSLLDNFTDIYLFIELYNNLKHFFEKYKDLYLNGEDVFKNYEINNVNEEKLKICTIYPNKYSTDINQIEAFKEIINMAKKGIYIYNSSIKLSFKEINLIRDLYDCLLSQEIINDLNEENLKIFNELSKNKSDKLNNQFNKFMKLIPKNDENILPINKCKCSGSILNLNNELICQKCYLKYCNFCWKKLKPNHLCKKDDLENVKLILSSTVACPNCGIRIEKESGCDEMFCTNCHIGFNWKTLKIITYNFENPHRDQWLINNSSKDHKEFSLINSIISSSPLIELELKYSYILKNISSKWNNLNELFKSIGNEYNLNIKNKIENLELKMMFNILDNYYNKSNIDRKIVIFRKKYYYYINLKEINCKFLILLTNIFYNLIFDDIYFENKNYRKTNDLNILKGLIKYIKNIKLLYFNHISNDTSNFIKNDIIDAINNFCKSLIGYYNILIDPEIYNSIEKINNQLIKID